MARVVPAWVTRAKKNMDVGLKHGFRSGLEDTLGQQIEANGQPVLFETFKVRYVVPQMERSYTPDFLLANGIIVEGKGIFDSDDRAKHLLLKAQYPELDIRFVFTRSKAPITKGSKTTLAMWCEKYGYKYSDKTIPAAWFTEPGPQRRPHVVLQDGPYGYALKTK